MIDSLKLLLAKPTVCAAELSGVPTDRTKASIIYHISSCRKAERSVSNIMIMIQGK
jgi:hypothetical protein